MFEICYLRITQSVIDLLPTIVRVYLKSFRIKL
jgi:hypothetical protein